MKEGSPLFLIVEIFCVPGSLFSLKRVNITKYHRATPSWIAGIFLFPFLMLTPIALHMFQRT